MCRRFKSVLRYHVFNGLSKHRRRLAAACQRQVSTRRQKHASSTPAGMPPVSSNSAARRIGLAASRRNHRGVEPEPDRAPPWMVDGTGA